MDIATRAIIASDMKALSLYKQEFIQHFRAKPGLIKLHINKMIPLFKYLKAQWDERTEAGTVLPIQWCICAVAPQQCQCPDITVFQALLCSIEQHRQKMWVLINLWTTYIIFTMYPISKLLQLGIK